MATRLRLATRGSPLARWQAARVADLLGALPEAPLCELVVISTRGDRLTDVPLPPSRPDFAKASAEPPAAALPLESDPQLISGAQPILDSTRFGLRVFSLRAEAARRVNEAAGG